jgi:hypothetical protein
LGAAPGTAAIRRRFGSLTAYDLVEVALLTSGGFVLHKEREAVLLEFVEPLVPINFFK